MDTNSGSTSLPKTPATPIGQDKLAAATHKGK